jgi:hypothetical protein
MFGRRFMIKKIFLSLLLFTQICSVAAEDRFYAFVMHATHDEVYDHKIWQQSVELIESLVRFYEENESNSPVIDINTAIQCIKDIFEVYKDRHGLHVTMCIYRKPFQFPTQGLFISINSAIEETSLENYNRIEALLKDFDGTSANVDDAKNMPQILELIQPVVSCTHGNIYQLVRNYECGSHDSKLE